MDDLCSISLLAVIPAGSMDNWYSRVKDEIRKQREDPVWMSEDKVSVILSFCCSIMVRNFVFLSRR